MLQKTIERTVHCSGIGLHSGQKVHMELHPAPVDQGIVFVVKTAQGKKVIHPGPEDIYDTSFATTIVQNGCELKTVEHLLAAIRGMELDNLIIEVDGNEVPIMDGSAASYVILINQAGISEQSRAKKYLSLKSEFFLQENGKWIKAYPANSFSVNFSIDFPHPLLGDQKYYFDLSKQNFTASLSKARTFGFLSDVEKLQNHGLIQGGSLENAVVLDESGVVNPEGLRFEDEPIRHKVLDFLGDMGLMQHQILGHFDVHCSGHALNATFLRILQWLEAGVRRLLHCVGKDNEKVLGKDVRGVPVEATA